MGRRRWGTAGRHRRSRRAGSAGVLHIGTAGARRIGTAGPQRIGTVGGRHARTAGAPRIRTTALRRAGTAGVLAVAAALLVAADRAPAPLPPLPSAAARELGGQVADPVRVRIPAIGVDAPVGPLEVDARGVLPPPEREFEAGWWRAGPEPGERGAAVLAGHVDSHSGAAVFFRLRELPGDARVLIDRADGSTAEFAVRHLGRYPKDRFPTNSVYGPTAHSELRIITCGGTFDHDRGRYRDNVIVFAARIR